MNQLEITDKILAIANSVEGEGINLAIECIKQINDCDVFILISDENGAGMYTELGIALQLSNQKNKPKIYIIGKYNERSVFFFHPLIIRVKTLEEIFTDLENT